MTIERHFRNGLIIDGNPYSREQLKIGYSGNNITIVGVTTGIPYSDITNGDTDAAFASMDELKQLISEEVYSARTNLPTVPSRPQAVSVDTSDSDGTAFVPFVSAACDALEVHADAEVDIEIKMGDDAVSITLAAGSSPRYIPGIEDADEISVKRTDESTTVLTVKAVKIFTV